MVVQAETLSTWAASLEVNPEMVAEVPAGQLQEQCLVLVLHQILVVPHLSMAAAEMERMELVVVHRDRVQVLLAQPR
jgi:hypothetical protein